YAKARRGELTNFTGIDSPYEPPTNPEIHLDASGAVPAEQSADQVVAYLHNTGILTPAERT
ncbi:adenylyl-sulfate kinase, partial [Frankia sp. CNm7]